MPLPPIANNQYNILEVDILIQGQAIPPEYNLQQVHIIKQVDGIPVANIQIAVTDLLATGLPDNFANYFSAGNTIQVQAGYGNSTNTIFTGIIMQQGIKTTNTGGIMLTLTCRDSAIRLTANNKTAGPANSTVLQQLITGYGLTCSIPPTPVIWQQPEQDTACDWEYILLAAAANGFMVLTDNGHITITPPDAAQPPILAVRLGECITGFDLQMAHALATATTPALQGWVQLKGTPMAAPGTTLSLQGFGTMCNSPVFVASVQHTIQMGNWLTTCTICMQPGWLACSAPIAAYATTALLPANINTVIHAPTPAINSIVLGDDKHSIIIADQHGNKATLSSTGIGLVTPNGNSILLSDNNQSIVITDQNSNNITLSATGISINSPKDVSITADSIAINARNNTTVSATGDAIINALNIKANAAIEVDIKGSATATLSSGMETTIKGAMVMIN